MTVEDALWHIHNVYTNLAQKDSQAAEPYRIAITALSKQIGLRPQKLEGKLGMHFLCPQCNRQLYFSFYVLFNGEKTVGSKTPYCESCGQRIDWEEEKSDE